MDLQSLFPVYLPKSRGEMSKEDYDDQVSQQENNLNQNLHILFQAIESLSAQVDLLGGSNGE